jgi:hypothetical protein
VCVRPPATVMCETCERYVLPRPIRAVNMVVNISFLPKSSESTWCPVQAGSKHILFGFEMPKNKYFMLPKVVNGTRRGNTYVVASRRSCLIKRLRREKPQRSGELCLQETRSLQ